MNTAIKMIFLSSVLGFSQYASADNYLCKNPELPNTVYKAVFKPGTGHRILQIWRVEGNTLGVPSSFDIPCYLTRSYEFTCNGHIQSGSGTASFNDVPGIMESELILNAETVEEKYRCLFKYNSED